MGRSVARMELDHAAHGGQENCRASQPKTFGKCAYGIFEKGSEFIGEPCGIAGGHLTGAQMAAALAKPGQEVALQRLVPPEYIEPLVSGAEEVSKHVFIQRTSNRTSAVSTGSVRFSRALTHLTTSTSALDSLTIRGRSYRAIAQCKSLARKTVPSRPGSTFNFE